MPQEIYENAKKNFLERYEKINWNEYHDSLPFNTSALSLYEWSPIAEELKSLDKKIVLNSMILKWDNVKKEFIELINFYVVFLFSTKLFTTLGSAKVVVSPNWSCSFAAIFLRILLIILPDLVFGSPGENCIKSGVAIGPICFLTQSFKSLSKSKVDFSPTFKVT